MKTYKSYLLVLIVSALGFTLSGCSKGVKGEDVIGMPGSPLWFSTASMATQVAYYKGECKAYGYIDGTTGMSDCLQSSIQNAKNRARARLDAFQYSQRQYNQSFRCTTFGATTTCNSY